VAVSQWQAPNTHVQRVGEGALRFYGLDGRIPEIVVAGAWAQITQVTHQPVRSSLGSRAYSTQDRAFLNHHWLMLDMQTWEPAYSVEVAWEGVNSLATVSQDIERNRTRYGRPADAAAFDASNVNGDFLEPHREDYSVRFGYDAARGEVQAFYCDATDGGTPLELHQEARQTFRINGRGRALRVFVKCTRGRFRLMGASVAAEPRTSGAVTIN